MNKKHMGSRFEDFLEDEGIREEVVLAAMKEVLSERLTTEMKNAGVTKQGLAKRMGTSRTVVHRLLDPSDTSTTMATIASASVALDLGVQILVTKKVMPKRPSERSRKSA